MPTKYRPFVTITYPSSIRLDTAATSIFCAFHNRVRVKLRAGQLVGVRQLRDHSTLPMNGICTRHRYAVSITSRQFGLLGLLPVALFPSGHGESSQRVRRHVGRDGSPGQFNVEFNAAKTLRGFRGVIRAIVSQDSLSAQRIVGTVSMAEHTILACARPAISNLLSLTTCVENLLRYSNIPRRYALRPSGTGRENATILGSLPAYQRVCRAEITYPLQTGRPRTV